MTTNNFAVKFVRAGASPAAVVGKKTGAVALQCVLAVLIGIAGFFASTVCAQVGNDNPTGVCGQFNGNVTTGCSYDPYTANATRSITDITVAGGTGAYPLAFTRTMTSRYIAGLPTEFGPAGSWRHSYQWSINTETTDTGRPGRYVVNYPDGRQITFSNTGTGDPDFRGPSGVRDRFEHLTAADQVNCKLVLPDGGKIWFRATLTHPNGRNRWTFRLHAIIDPYGQTTLITYPNNEYTQINDSSNTRCLRIYYRTITNVSEGHVGDVVIDHVSASDNRTVSYGYSAYVSPNGTRYTSLHQVRYFGSPWWDAFYTYQNSNAPDANDRPLIKTCIDPMFDGPMWMIAYSFAGTNVYGKLQSEKYFDGTNIGSAVSTLSVDNQAHTRAETRGDTGHPTRTFTYSANSYKLRQVSDFYSINAFQTYDPSTGYLATATDRKGNTTTYECKWKGGSISKITSATPVNVIPPNTPTVIDYRYAGDSGCNDANNNDADNPYYVCKIINGPTYTRFPNKQVQRIDYPATQAGNSYETFTYNDFGQVKSHRMRNGYIERWVYDQNDQGSRVVEYRDGAHQNTAHPIAWYQYNSLGRVSGITDGNGTYSGDPAHTTTFQYNAPGQLIRITHPDGSYIQYFYWTNRTLMATTDERHPTTTDPDQATVYFYDDYKRLRTVTTPKRSGNDNLSRTTTYYYDQNGVGEDYMRTVDAPTRVISPGGKVVKTTYDNNLRAQTVRVFGDSNVGDALTTYGYDNNGNVTTVQDPRNYITTYEYDALDRVKSMIDPIPGDRDGDGYTMYFWYDPSGNLKKQKRADGKTCIFEYNPMGFMQNRTGYAGEYTEYVPDVAGNLYRYKFRKADNTFIVYQYDYDEVNRLKKVTYPVDAPPDNRQRTEEYEYDVANHLWHYWNPDHRKKTLTYDARGRLTDTIWENNLAPNLHIEYDVASRPTYVSSTNGTRIDFAYDEANNRTWELQTVGAIASALRTDPDPDGNRSDLFVYYWGNPTPVSVNYFDYTSRNELLNINDINHAGFFKYSYDPAGNVIKRQRVGWQDRAEMPDYDGLNRLQHFKQYDHGGTLFDTIDYLYTKIGNLDHTVRSDYGGGKGDWCGYDDINQARKAVYNATSLGQTNPHPDKIVTYVCGNRNRTSMTVDDYLNNQHYTTTYTPVDLNQYKQINGINIYWDNNFNLSNATAYNSWSYTYDAENRLTSASGPGHNAQFTYDPLGRCVTRTIDGTTRIMTYDQWTPVAEWDAGGNLLATNVFGFGDDEILYRKTSSAQYYYRADGVGNVKFIQDGNGALLEKYAYDAFGKPTVTQYPGKQATGQRFMFSGREYFNELGLYDMRNRVYDPVMGRFYQTDPIGLQGDPLNLYRFCGHNPVLGGDPLGLQGEDEDWTGSDSLPSEEPTPFQFTFSAPLSLDDGWMSAAAQAIVDDIFASSLSSSTTADDLFFVSTSTSFMVEVAGVSLRNARVAIGPDIRTATSSVNFGLSRVSTTYFASGHFGIDSDAPLGDAILLTAGLRLLGAAASMIGAESSGRELVPSAVEDSPWAGGFRNRVAGESETAYRVWGNRTDRVGKWLTPDRPVSATQARRLLSLPPGNSAEAFSEIKIPSGTPYRFGTAAAKFGEAGGGRQIELLKHIPPANFGPGTALPPH